MTKTGKHREFGRIKTPARHSEAARRKATAAVLAVLDTSRTFDQKRVTFAVSARPGLVTGPAGTALTREENP